MKAERDAEKGRRQADHGRRIGEEQNYRGQEEEGRGGGQESNSAHLRGNYRNKLGLGLRSYLLYSLDAVADRSLTRPTFSV